MADLRTRLDRFAERGEHRGAAEVYQDARRHSVERGLASLTISRSEPDGAGRRHGRGRVLAIVVAILVVAGGAAVVASTRTGSRVVVAQPATTRGALATEPSATLYWYDGNHIVAGDPRSGRQVSLSSASHACDSCPNSRVGRYVFVDQPRILRVDTSDGRVRDLGPGLSTFPTPDGDSLYVVVSDESSETETAPIVITDITTVERIDVNGRVLGGPWTVPAGEVLTGPPRAVAGGILTETNNSRGDQILSVWDPDTGHVARIGPFRELIDTYTARGATSSTVAYTAAGCRTVGCGLEIARVPGGASRRVVTPGGAPGFIGGGAFSPDGRQLAAFIDRVPESENPGGQLVIVDVATARAETIAGSTVSFGEPFGFATWSPDGRWVYFGGLSAQVKAHYRDTPDAVSLTLPANYSVVAGSPDSAFRSLR